MRIILDLEIPSYGKQYEVPEEVQSLIGTIKSLFAGRLNIISHEINKEAGIIIYNTGLQKVFAVGFSEKLQYKIEDLFSEDDLNYFLSKLNR